MADIQATQANVLVGAVSAGGSIRAAQAYVLAGVTFPADFVRATQGFILAGSKSNTTMRATQAYVLAGVKGQVADPTVRAWTYTMDGHDFYVLRLGNDETLVYDTNAEQWYVWGRQTSDLWQPLDGINWPGGMFWAERYGSNVVVGDDGNGAIYFLDPTAYVDEDANDGSTTPRTFERIITGQVVLDIGYDVMPCFEVQLLGSIGEMNNSSLTTVTLYTSDDRGNTYDSHGAVTLANSDYDARASWLSLGSIEAPGRLFKVVDTGALQRIDMLRMIDGSEDG